METLFELQVRNVTITEYHSCTSLFNLSPYNENVTTVYSRCASSYMKHLKEHNVKDTGKFLNTFLVYQNPFFNGRKRQVIDEVFRTSFIENPFRAVDSFCYWAQFPNIYLYGDNFNNTGSVIRECEFGILDAILKACNQEGSTFSYKHGIRFKFKFKR